MRRAQIEEVELDRLADLAHCAGVALMCMTDVEGELTFSVSGLGTFHDVQSLEHALADAVRVTS